MFGLVETAARRFRSLPSVTVSGNSNGRCGDVHAFPLREDATMTEADKRDQCDWHRTPLGLIVLCTVAVAFGGQLVLLALTEPTAPRVMMTIATGTMFLAGLALAIVSARRTASRKLNTP